MFFDRIFFTIFPLPTPIDKRTQSVSTTNDQRYVFPPFSVPSFDHYSSRKKKTPFGTVT